MLDVTGLPSVFLIGLVASTIGTMVGGGSLLSIPFLMFVGLPPQVAIATDRFGGLGVAATALYKFWTAGKIVWKYVPILALASLAGSVIGANALVRFDPVVLKGTVGFLIIALLPTIFLGRGVGVEVRETSWGQLLLGLGIYFLVQILAGFLAAGTGTMIYYTLMLFFGVTITQVAATQILPFLVLTVSSLLIFAAHGLIEYRVGMVLIAGTAVGGYLGAHLAITQGDAWVRRLFAVVVLVLGARLLLSLWR
jgi:uncharacterized protein